MSSSELHLVRESPDPAVEFCDHNVVRSIEVSAALLGADQPQLTVRWQRMIIDGVPDESSEEIFIGGQGDAFVCAAATDGAWYRPATPDLLRGLSQLLAQLADRVEHDATAYGALAARSAER